MDLLEKRFLVNQISLQQSYGDLKMLFWSTLSGLALLFLLWRMTRTQFPTVNAYFMDFGRRKAYQEYMQNATKLVAMGFEKFRGPFQIYTPNGPRLILPSSYMDWVKSCKDLDHQQLVHQDFFADYSGFEGQKFVTNPNRLLIDVTRLRLSQNPRSILIMNEQLGGILKETWTDQKDWHTLDWPQDTMKIISRMSASIFVGPQLARNEEWQKLTITYTTHLFAAVAALRRWPAVMRPLVHWFLPESEKCREQVRLTRKMMQNVLNERAKEKDIGDSSNHDDAITWMEETAAGKPYDPAAGQLALAISALHTTSEAFRQVLLDLCLNEDLIQPVREEITTVLSENGMSLAALAKMELLDSVLKESQRLTSACVGVERKVIRETKLPNGTKIPRGSNIAIDSSDMWNADVHENPLKFDGYRFLRMRKQGGVNSSKAAFVSSTKEHNTFGAGKFICPGRFFVANELKVALAHVLLKYDIRLQNGQKPRNLRYGFYGMTDLDAKVEVRRREIDLSSVFDD